jgi:hypothetical protein
MNCVNHSDVAAVAYCRTCGKALCNACSRNVSGVIYCENCVAQRMHGAAAQSASGQPPIGAVIPAQTRPVVAGLLGFIPGVGAMYNGQFTKGVIHALAFVVLVFLTTHFPLIGILIGFAVFYMVFDAYKTAEAIQHGLPVPDPFGLEAMFGPGVNQTTWQGQRATSSAASSANPAPGAPQQEAYAAQEAPYEQSCGSSSGVPIGAVILIGLGFMFLLDNMGWFSFSMDRLWPVSLIVIGGWMIFKRWTRRVS